MLQANKLYANSCAALQITIAIPRWESSKPYTVDWLCDTAGTHSLTFTSKEKLMEWLNRELDRD
jgi:hypothetical protein